MLALFNDSDDMDAAIQQALAMITPAVGGRVGEIWLTGGTSRRAGLRHSFSDGSRGARAFEAAGRALGVSAGPDFVVRVLKNGRGCSVPVSAAHAAAERSAEAAALGVHAAFAYPIRTRTQVVGVLAVFTEDVERPHRAALDVIPAACHHIGRFLERARAGDDRQGAVRAGLDRFTHRVEEPA
jgi:hypothetical protein